MLTLYKASAGSGKTYTLAREYIKLLLGRKDRETGHYTLRRPGSNAHRSILAITFTIAATNEMKRRIIEHLQLLSLTSKNRPEDRRSPYMDYLCELYSADEAEVADRAREALKELLFDFNQFNISTIDAFFQTVLRTFAREIELPGNYEVELDEERIIGVGIGEMISSINFRDDDSTRRLTRWITNYMSQSIDDGKGFNLFNRQSSLHEGLVKTMHQLLNEDFKLNRESIIDYLQGDPQRLERFEAVLAKEIADLKARSTRSARSVVKAVTDYGLADTKSVNANLLKFMVKSATEGWQEKLSATIATAPAEPKKRYTAAYLKKGEPPEALDRAIVDGCAEIARCHGLVTEYRLLRRNLYNLGLLGYLLRFVGEYRRENDIILLSDTNELLQRIIRDDMTPFIYERIGYFLNHFLIDEFQDTSRMQWHNLRPLLMESLAQGNDNLIIGDEKQCIYRFRNSDPDLLATEVKASVENGISGAVAEKGINVTDNTNWRSAADIVKFNNSFFTSIARIAGVTGAYANITQQVSPKHESTPGYIDLASIDAPRGGEPSFEDLALSRMADAIRRQRAAGYRAKDIAVIVRRRSEGEAVVNHLLRLMDDPDSGFPKMEITSSDSIELQSSAAVRLIISVLQIIDAPDSSSSSRHKTARQLARLVNRFEYFYNRANLDGRDALARALDDDDGLSRLATEASDIACVNLPSMVERIITRYLSKREREDNNIFLSSFQDLVIDFCSRGLCDVHSFLQWWQQSGRFKKLETPADMDALTVTTIHKVKGLQYPCVHLPFATWAMTEYSGPGKSMYGWFSLPPMENIDSDIAPPLMPINIEAALAGTRLAPELERVFGRQRVDNINLLYVAFTRAERELIVTTLQPPARKEEADRLKSEPITRYITEAIENCGDTDTDLTMNLNGRWDGSRLIIGSPTAPETAAGAEALSEEKFDEMPAYIAFDREDMWQLTRVDDIVGDRARARERGIFMHDVLSRVRRRGELDMALRRRAYRVGMDARELEATRLSLENALDDPRAAKWFDSYSRVLNERTIMLPPGEHYRPDRVVWTADGEIAVIDYKFGAVHKDAYRRQVRRYMAFLATIFPDTPIRGYLWYPDSNTIDEVSR